MTEMTEHDTPSAGDAAPDPDRPEPPPHPAPADRPRSVYRAPDGTTTRDLPLDALTDALGRCMRGDGVLWVDVDSKRETDRRVLTDVFHFHPLSVSDALSPATRVKVQEYGDRYLLLVLRAVRFRAETPDDPYDVETINLSIFLAHNFVVTVHSEPAPSVDAIVTMAERSPDLLDNGAARLAYLVADDAIDAFFPILDQIDDFIDSLEQRVFESAADRTTLQELFRVKRLVLSLRRYLTPQRDVFNAVSTRPFAVLPAGEQLYFRDVYDHVLRINDSLDTFRDLLSGTLDAYLSQVSNRLGQITKGLSVVATLSLPFVVISGMWGMNVDHIPLQHRHHAFALMLLAQLVIGVALVALLRWRRLL